VPAQAQVTSGQVLLTYVDRPDVSETFVDSLEKCLFDGSAVRLEFVVNRIAQAQPGKQPEAVKMTASRLVTTLPGLVSLASHVNGMINALKAQGVIQEGQAPPSTAMN
jgi:hypothetical protein